MDKWRSGWGDVVYDGDVSRAVHHAPLWPTRSRTRAVLGRAPVDLAEARSSTPSTVPTTTADIPFPKQRTSLKWARRPAVDDTGRILEPIDSPGVGGRN